MKKFWARTNLGSKSKSQKPLMTKSISTECKLNANATSSGCPTGFNQIPPDLLLHANLDNTRTFPKTSRLSKTLSDILTDKGALNYFIQYLDAKHDNKGFNWIKFWLDAEHFQTATRVNDCETSTSDTTLTNVATNRTKITHKRSLSQDCQLDDIHENDDFPNTSNANYTSDFRHNNGYNATRTTCTTPVSDCQSCCSTSNDYSVYDSRDMSTTDTTSLTPSPIACEQQHFFSYGITCKITADCDRKSANTPTNDAYRIFAKFIELDAPLFIEFSDCVRNDIVNCLTNNNIQYDIFKAAQSYIYASLDETYYKSFTKSDFYVKHQVDVLTSGSMQISDVLYNETALFYFMEYLEQENCRNLLDCWISLYNFRHQCESQSQSDLRTTKDSSQDMSNMNSLNPLNTNYVNNLQSDAMVLYDKYFSLQATHSVGFADKIRLQIEENICTIDGAISAECFAQPMRMIEFILNEYYLKTFMTSQLFYQYITELINVIQNSSSVRYQAPNGYEKLQKKSGSNCSSSEMSVISSSMTVNDEPIHTNGVRMRAKHTERATGTLTPDELWRKRKSDGLVLGRVNELGRFETNYDKINDLDEEKRNGTKVEKRLSSMMKRLVLFGENKDKEEMAWQVAEMIVKDITSVTLNNSPKC